MGVRLVSLFAHSGLFKTPGRCPLTRHVLGWVDRLAQPPPRRLNKNRYDSPMGKASRRKKVAVSADRPAYRPPIPFVERPFEGLPNEVELVAMREIIPCATLSGRTTEEHGGADFDIVTLLPDGHPAMIRPDGRILIGLQTRSNSGDLSHDVAAALLAALQAQSDGVDGVIDIDVREPAPRLQDIVDPKAFGDMEIVADFGYWFDPNQELSPEMRDALEQNRADVVPTAAVPGTEGMYWCEMNRNFVRYVSAAPEHKLFDALARLQAAGNARLGEGSRFVGAFRACGLAIPVFELAEGASAEDVAADAKALAENVEKALKETTPLSADERRARQGLVSRQVTIR